jgi:hypothetical protein
MFSASTKTSTPSVSAPDPQFNYVTMLLHGDGTNGAQNNTFLDSSTNNFTITRNGNTTQGSFSPYGPVGNWSTFFDGTQDNLYTASTTALNVGSGNFTFECFFNVSVFNGGNILRGANQYSACALLLSGTGVIYYISSNGASWDIASGQTAISSGLIAGVWYHLALVRNGNVVTPYVNGVAGTTTTTSASFSANNGFNIGAEQNGVAGGSFNGFISNVRVVVGTAVYTSNFTPPTANLTAITGTQLLACQNNRFIDNSSNNFSFTIAGTPSIQRFNPFGTVTAYSTSVIGGSGYFDGSGDYLTTTLTGQTFGTGNFTAEGWFYQTANVSYNTLMAQRTTGNSATGWIVGSDSAGSVYAYSNGFLIGPTGTAIKNQWNHIAFVRSSGTMTLYLNGVSLGTSATSKTFSDTFAGIGGDGADAYVLSGYASNVRYVVGTAVYTTTFTPPTAPLTAISGTSLLANFTNGAIFDNAMMNDLETVGNAQISTSVVKYGTGSLAFDGNGDYLLSNPANIDLYAFGTGNFTIEFWLYLNSTSAAQVFYDSRPASSQGFQPTINTNSGILYYYTNSTNEITGNSLSTNTWYHIAVARSGTSTKMFVNGTQVGSTYTDSTNYVNSALRPMIGADGFSSGNPGQNPMNGYIDDLRVTKGYARYTANFTPPSAAFSNTGPI